MKIKLLVQLAAMTVALAACGGGGSSSSADAAATPAQSGDASSAPVASAPPPYTLSPSSAKATYVAGTPVAIDLTARQTVTFFGLTYIQIAADSAIIQSPISITPNMVDGTFAVKAMTSPTAPPGHYAGNFTVRVCNDPVCKSQLDGSPFNVPYDIDVVPPEGGVIAYKLSGLSPLAGAKDWGTYQGDAAHTGFVPVTLSSAAFTPRWKWISPSYNGVQWAPSSLTNGGGRVYLSSGGSWINGTGHEVFAFKEFDGSQVWSHSFANLSTPSANPPAYAHGKVFISAGSQESTAMFAFDAASGVQAFTSKMSSQWESYLAPTILDGVVYTNGGSYGGMFAFDEVTGVQKYFTNLPQYDGWTPAVDGAYAYGYMSGALQIVDIQTGKSLSAISDPTYSWNGYTTNGAPVIGAAGSVFAGNFNDRSNNAIVNFDTVKMTTRWSATGAYAGNPAYASGTLFAANNKPFRLEARKEMDGTVLWSWVPPTGEAKFVSDVLVTNNLVFVSADAHTYAIDKLTHAAVWSFAASGTLSLSANGILYIAGSKSIAAINLH